jgi:hypothetical protein
MNTNWTVFTVTMIVLTGALILAVYWPWPDVMQPERRLHLWAIPGCTECAEADPPPCDEHGARELARMPRYHLERVIHRPPNPQDFDALENLLADPVRLEEAGAAEQDARLSAEPDNEGLNR